MHIKTSETLETLKSTKNYNKNYKNSENAVETFIRRNNKPKELDHKFHFKREIFGSVEWI